MSGTWGRDPGWGVVDRPEEGEHGGRLYAAPLATGEIRVLEGPTAVVCRAALRGLDVHGIHEETARSLSVGTEDVDAEVVAEVLDELTALGVLRPR